MVLKFGMGSLFTKILGFPTQNKHFLSMGDRAVGLACAYRGLDGNSGSVTDVLLTAGIHFVLNESGNMSLGN